MLEAKKTSSLVAQSIAALTGALATGYAAGRLGTTTLGPIGLPAGLAVGLAGLVVSYKWAPKSIAPLTSALSIGALGAWGAMWAAGTGSQARQQKKGDSSPIVSGAPMLPRAKSFTATPSFAGVPAPRAMPAPTVGSAWGAGKTPFPAPGRPLSEAELQAMQQISRQVGFPKAA